MVGVSQSWIAAQLEQLIDCASLRELAVEMGVNRETLRRQLAGGSRFTLETVVAFSRQSGVMTDRTTLGALMATTRTSGYVVGSLCSLRESPGVAISGLGSAETARGQAATRRVVSRSLPDGVRSAAKPGETQDCAKHSTQTP